MGFHQRCCWRHRNTEASIAQLVELLICNQWVGGSSPSAGSNVFFHKGGVPERPKGTDCKSVGDAFGGSNPPPTTTRHKLNVGDSITWVVWYYMASCMKFIFKPLKKLEISFHVV